MLYNDRNSGSCLFIKSRGKPAVWDKDVIQQLTRTRDFSRFMWQKLLFDSIGSFGRSPNIEGGEHLYFNYDSFWSYSLASVLCVCVSSFKYRMSHHVSFCFNPNKPGWHHHVSFCFSPQ
jgi:hypothetical protein